MEVAISKWGNSQGIRIPKQVLDKVHLKIGAKVDVAYEAGHITLTPVEEKKFDIYQVVKNIDAPQKEHEVDWGKSEGAEEW